MYRERERDLFIYLLPSCSTILRSCLTRQPCSARPPFVLGPRKATERIHDPDHPPSNIQQLYVRALNRSKLLFLSKSRKVTTFPQSHDCINSGADLALQNETAHPHLNPRRPTT